MGGAREGDKLFIAIFAHKKTLPNFSGEGSCLFYLFYVFRSSRCLLRLTNLTGLSLKAEILKHKG